MTYQSLFAFTLLLSSSIVAMQYSPPQLKNYVSEIEKSPQLDLTRTRVNARALAAALMQTETLRMLDLSWTSLSSDDVITIANAIKVNRSLKVLLLWHNVIDDKAANALGEAISVSTTLEKLYLSHTNISEAGRKDLVQGLKTNGSLMYLDLPSVGSQEMKDYIATKLAANKERKKIFEKIWPVAKMIFSTYQE